MSTPALSTNTRQSACSARRAKHASKRRGFCHTHRDVSTLVTAYKPGDRTGGLVFLQTDPIPGGSANAYDYCFQDPINCTDLNGQLGWPHIHWRHIFHAIGTGLAVASYGFSWIPTPVGGLATAAAGIWSSDFYKFAGDNQAGNRELASTAFSVALTFVGGRATSAVTQRALRYLSKQLLGTDVGVLLCGRPWTGCSPGFGHSRGHKFRQRR